MKRTKQKDPTLGRLEECLNEKPAIGIIHTLRIASKWQDTQWWVRYECDWIEGMDEEDADTNDIDWNPEMRLHKERII